jgi:thioesterase domain-containing protein
MTLAEQLEQTLHDEIPLSRAMGIHVAAYDGKQLSLTAPLAPNINHKCTAFGGSLYSLAVLCGWGMVHLKLHETGLHRHIVIQQADIDYLLPVTRELIAQCSIDPTHWEKCLHTLKKRGRARIALDVSILEGTQVAVAFCGRYVMHG